LDISSVAAQMCGDEVAAMLEYIYSGKCTRYFSRTWLSNVKQRFGIANSWMHDMQW
jgi:hypothetical protein